MKAAFDGEGPGLREELVVQLLTNRIYLLKERIKRKEELLG